MSNCLLYALARWWRDGGYVIVRKSHHGWWPHFLWSPDLVTFYQYGPAAPNHHLLIPPPLFHGIVRQHGAPETRPNKKGTTHEAAQHAAVERSSQTQSLASRPPTEEELTRLSELTLKRLFLGPLDSKEDAEREVLRLRRVKTKAPKDNDKP